jgi:hypothetical protein
LDRQHPDDSDLKRPCEFASHVAGKLFVP